ncbi:MAG: glycoside hydrolase family 88 protein [Bacteroidales bacterium]|nr:glycoside hydrolase family 88 protein [Bacteroidales bacterium]
MRRLIVFWAALAAMACGRTQEAETMEQLRGRVFAIAQVQAVYMDSLLTATTPADRRCPRTFQGDTLVTSDIGWWCSGFYPGILWMVYEETDDPQIRELAVRHTLPLAGLLDRETDHDIGFQLMSSFGKMVRFPEADPVGADSVLTGGACVLAARFIPEAGVIRSWNWGPWNIPVIIDNMMNLELLLEYGDREIAEKHALTTAVNHFRDDGTCVHLVDYADDGSILGSQTVQGYADDSAWARGQAWALYGFALMAQKEWEAGNDTLAQRYFKVAAKLEDWLLARLPEDGIPYWDFSQTDYKDASAGAILACGLLRMWELDGCEPDDPSFRMAGRILRTLASPEYLAEPRTNGGFLLKHSVGNMPGGTEIDVPLTYADYYFLEALTLFPEVSSL